MKFNLKSFRAIWRVGEIQAERERKDKGGERVSLPCVREIKVQIDL